MRRKFRIGSSRFFGIPDDILPEIKSSATIFGYISKGILRGIPVGAVLGDQQAALVGQQCWSKGTAKSTSVNILFFS